MRTCIGFSPISVIISKPDYKENGPKTVKDVKLISAGRILENNKTVGDCRSPVGNFSGAVTTMHVIIQHQVTEKEKKKKKKPKGDLKQNKCVCLCFGARC
ncbi:UBL3-like ubiquitin domain [Arabidopsis thaliana x Arabidopsis arenosa]|uniref:UBL3-like ubiquitin domain n=1 Tax=Arabidopsis thaliana x Arabidopsis arenosa TaxID=1240361 RepID=A0A8T2CVD8_9BRAS|nr:UBL3-like ubiquitin domain [Arabidopsis thaliana x Arabidopsis arenosa]